MLDGVMHLVTVVMVAVSAIVAFAALRPRLLRNPTWRATVTPLASIIGSGFLVVAPILAHAAGNWAWLAMLVLCLVAYLFGSAIRHNIAVVEPMLDGDAPNHVKLLERTSELALTFAYFISVAYYLNLFAAFALRGAGVDSQFWVRSLSTLVIASIGVLGLTKGLRGLELIEESAVGLKLGLIAGLTAAMAVFIATAVLGGDFALPALDHATGTRELAILLGLIILVQGFETSRYLGDAYDRETRIRTMRSAQFISTGIYVAFVLLATPFFTDLAPATGKETAIIDMLAPISLAVAPLVIAVALASQLSAAVADLNGAGGLLSAASNGRVALGAGYLATTIFAIAITWAANIYEIIVYASKAFVIYYGLQCLQAFLGAWSDDSAMRIARLALFGLGIVIALAVLFLGIPADA
ncbi:MAG: hypothetical protein M9905_19170 [Rhizobiaceae bacterium]|nr:hypothetical protein [Rhizobiaceae bacterium]